MAQKTIPELNAISELEDTDVLPVDNGTQTYKATVAQLKNAVTANSDFQESASAATVANTANNTWADVTGLSVTIETDGNTPVFVGVQGNRASGDRDVQAGIYFSTTDADFAGAFAFVRNTESTDTFFFANLVGQGAIVSNVRVLPGALWMIDEPPAGVHTYRLTYLAVSSGTHSLNVENIRLAAYKLAPLGS